ncbi:LOG family protein [Candidatus Gracilibacteria bacterium]|nr:LOG family protein [Candidatus Gracilibacteria bacterium]
MGNIFKHLPNYKLTIGVMGSASGYLMHNKKIVAASREIGRQIAKRGCILGNGACPGLPDEAAQGAKEAGGETYGVSPAISLESHLEKYRSPIEHYDNFLFTGVGLMMRDIINIRSAEGVIILPGGTGTLNEFTVAYDEGKPIGVLTGHDGVADHIKDILRFCHREVTDRMIFSDNPEELVKGLLKIIKRVGSEGSLDDYLIGHDGAVTKIESKFKNSSQLPLLDTKEKS